jgi:DNA polymerase-1
VSEILLGGEPVTIHTGDALGLPTSGLLGLDVESTYLTDKGQWDSDFRVRTVQFATTTEAWVFDLSDPIQYELARVQLDHREMSFCSHTDMDVLAVWREFGIDISHRNVDTRMLAIQADPDNNSDRDLKTLATKYGMPELAAADKELYAWMVEHWVFDGGKKNAKRTAIEEHGWNDLAEYPYQRWPEVFTRYAGLDAIACRRLAEILVPQTQAPAKLIEVDQWLHVRATRQRLAGKRIDVEALDEMLTEAREVTGRAKANAELLTGGININGPKIIGWLGEHGVDWDRWEGATTPSGAPSLAGDKNIKLLLNFPLKDPAVEVVELMIEQKGHLDLLRKTEDISKRMVDGRIHPLLNPIGATTTARMSSSGPNVQNFSKKDPRMRGLFLPEPGCTFVTIDFDQIELRVVAALAREEKMIDAVLAGYNLHDLTVDLLAERGIEITYETAKMTNFLIVYGGGGKALHEQAGIPLDVAYEIVRQQRDAYPAIDAYSKWMGMEREAIRTISNRRLPVTRVKGSGERAGDIRAYANVNYAVQSASRELLCSSWMQLEEKRPGVVWLPVHDELVMQVPDDEIEAVIEDAEAAMRFEFRGVPISATAIVLRDEKGVSRWMTSKHAEKCAVEMAAITAHGHPA